MIDPLFDKLAPSEQPDPLLAGSSRALSRPISHLFKYLQLSGYVPWPIGSWPVGLRHALRPPADPKIVSKTLKENVHLLPLYFGCIL